MFHTAVVIAAVIFFAVMCAGLIVAAVIFAAMGCAAAIFAAVVFASPIPFRCALGCCDLGCLHFAVMMCVAVVVPLW